MKYCIIILAAFSILSCQENHKSVDYLSISHHLEGKWQAKAFDGELHETWKLNASGWMHQQGYYIENGDTSYSAKTIIEQVGEDIILFSVIKDANPKIFKAKSIESHQIIFENDDYKNPFQVQYEFLSDGLYRRTITGYEQDSMVSYRFDFKRL